MGAAYAKIPELLAYDRNIAKLEILRTKVSGKPQLIAEIDTRIQIEKEKKLELIQSSHRLTVAERGDIKVSNGPIKSLLSISEDIRGLGLSEEHTGQILEAVSILLKGHPKANINDVNRLVGLLRKQLARQPAQDQWKTRESVVEFAKSFTESKRLKKPEDGSTFTESPKLHHSENRNPSALETRLLPIVLLAVVDGLAVGIHATPLPGSSAIAGGVTVGSVLLEKGVIKFPGEKLKRPDSESTDFESVTTRTNELSRGLGS